MIRRYYLSVISLKYSFWLTSMSLVIFALAFLYVSGKVFLKPYLAAAAAVLAVMLFLYYRDKIRLSHSLKKIKEIQTYSNSPEIDSCYFQEERMIGYGRKKGLLESDYSNLKELKLASENHGTFHLELMTEEDTMCFRSFSKKEIQALAAFLKRKQPNLLLTGIQPEGSGSLSELHE